jgi:hypothetical protein
VRMELRAPKIGVPVLASDLRGPASASRDEAASIDGSLVRSRSSDFNESSR